MMRPKIAVLAAAAFLTSRAGMFVILAFLLATQNTYASTLAASLFLSRLGAEAMPIYYVLFALVSIPCSTVISTVIDRFPRPVILKFMLGLFVAITVTMSALLGLGEQWFYVVYLGISVCEQLLYSIFYVLFADYFTVTEAKRVTGRITIGMALGGLAGGAGVALITSFAGPRFALPLTPVLVGLVFIYFGLLTRQHRSLGDVEPAAEESLTESLRVVPRMLTRYPMVALLSGAMFLNVLLQCMSEYLAFSIYSLHYPNVDQLASFLGLVHAGLNLLGFVIVVAFTDPQMSRLGVATMNRVYPALNTLSFGVLSFSTSLPAGILANIAYDPFVHSIEVPVTTMNYNAIRHRLVGRVRVFVDGVVYPLGLAVAGGLLIVLQRGLDLYSIAAIGCGISLLLFVLHWHIGKHYARGLLDMLRDGALDFDAVGGALRLQPETIVEIRGMLAGDPRSAYAGLEMALRGDHEFTADELGSALAKISTAHARPIFERLAANATPARIETFENLVRTHPAVRQLAIEALAQAGAPVADCRALIADADEGIRSVAAATILAAEPDDTSALAVLRGPLHSDAALGAIAVLRARGGDTATAILPVLGRHPDAVVRAAALAAAGATSVADSETLAWAGQAALDEAARVREAAFALLIGSAGAGELDALVEAGLCDPALPVRQGLVTALVERGKVAAPALYRQLHSRDEGAQLAAIEALGRIEGPAAEDELYRMFATDVFPAIELNRKLAQSMPIDRPGWGAMKLAFESARARTFRIVMHTLEALGHRKTVGLVRATLKAADPRTRAQAIESLESLPQRRFVVPLAPLFQGTDDRDDGAAFDLIRSKDLLRLALSARDEGLRAAAAVAWHAETGEIPASTLNDPSQLVTDTARCLKQRSSLLVCPYQQEVPMNRLAFLHSVPLFADATLDDLIVIDRTLSCETYLDGERIVTEGDPGDRLCIVYRGEVVVRKKMPSGERELARLKASDFFGEMSLFDDEPRSATVAAVNDVEVLVLNRDRFHSLVHQRPSILIELCTTLVQRLRKAVG